MRVRFVSICVLIFVVFAVSGLTQEAGRSVIPVDSQWSGARPFGVDITADGRYVVYMANRGDGLRDFIHDLQQGTTREVSGAGDGPYFPEISPDGKWLMFGKKMWIWKMPVAGGPLTLLHTINNWNTWETSDTVLVSKGANGIWRLKADGSTLVNARAEQVAPLDKAAGATSYHRPSLLPGGRGVLVMVTPQAGAGRIGIVSLPGGKLTLLDEAGVNPRYSESGHILYTQGSSLRAIPFDLATLKTTGPGVTIVEGVQVLSNSASQFDISSNGVLVYTPGPSQLGRVWQRRLVWVDRAGRESPFDTSAEKAFGLVRLSPNKRYLAAEAGSVFQLFDRQSGTWSVLAEGANIGSPVWSADNSTIYYSKSGVFGRQGVKPGDAWEELWKGDAEFWPLALSRDDNQMLGSELRSDTGMWRLMKVGLEAPRATGPLLDAGSAIRRSPVLSPNRQWLAYVEREAGLDHVYVQPYPRGGTPVRVSDGGVGEGCEPLWSRTSDELFYRDGVNIVSVRLETTPTLLVKQRTPLFSSRMAYNHLNAYAAAHDYDSTTDRFLMVRYVIPELPGEDIVVIRNAFELLNRLAPKK